jgi:phosphopantothenoylcysteine decarboxylase/phosphopantothenate--cysteine ligase
MHRAVMSRIAGQQVFIAVAAVADWHVANASAQKLKKSDVQKNSAPALEFVLNEDILAAVAALPSPPFCVGFAAESENLLAYGEAKRKKKNVPLLVGNIAQAAFGQDQNTLTLFDAHGHTELPRAGKQALADRLIAEIARRL